MLEQLCGFTGDTVMGSEGHRDGKNEVLGEKSGNFHHFLLVRYLDQMFISQREELGRPNVGAGR